ncbi:MAG: hypothetical protein JO005_00440 [Gammaproteobacteria bacterium]|nr:hypothetical protein [Gammaproteobacteria bacterium]
MRWTASGLAAALGWTLGGGALADPAPFDLAGPTIEVTVTRAGVSLPAAEVPELASGDRLWLKADLPPEQGAHYVMVAVFLRGSTNPPPPEWFIRCDTWGGRCAHEGLTLTVPEGAQQMLLFLAPSTGGDFKTLVNAVRGRPGAFVRSSQELNQASLDRARLDAYLAAIRGLEERDPGALKNAAPLLARSLAIKVDEKCLDKLAVLQAGCLMQGRESLILSDGHSASVTQTLTTGPASDLAMAASATTQLRSGYFGPYIGSLFDIARLFDSFHTAQYQYIPALGLPSGQALHLTLNAAPSFHDPKSVLVAGLPAVETAAPPPLRPAEPAAAYCARRSDLVLPVDGAPLVFATQYAHDLALRVPVGGTTFELPAHADASRGGMAVDATHLPALGSEGVRATLHGRWGFSAFDGPSFQLEDAHPDGWSLAAGESANLIVGREALVHLHSGSSSCLKSIALADGAGTEHKVEWTAKAGAIEAHLPLQEVGAGSTTLIIQRYGAEAPQRLELHTFAEGSRLERFSLHARDAQGVLRGTRLDQVQSLLLEGEEFVPAGLATHDGVDELTLSARNPRAVSALHESELSAQVVLRDGRTFPVKTLIESPRPAAQLIAKSAKRHTGEGELQIKLGSEEELPQDAQLTFSLRAQAPAAFARDARIEVATADESAATTLDVGSGAMTLQNARVAVGTLRAAQSLGMSAFGPLRYRVVSGGVSGDWRPLATLVRLPVLRGLTCPAAEAEPCMLSGSNLFLLESVASNREFTDATRVPDGFTGHELAVPHPGQGPLYLRLRDDPGVTSELKVPDGAAPAAAAVERHPES